MKHTYKITGMTCGSCKSSVEKSLRNIDEVSDVEVNLENQEATITMNSHIKVTELQKSLASTTQTTIANHLLYSNSKYIITL
jgi:copper chaperone CopZ